MYKVQYSMTSERVYMEHNEHPDSKTELINNDEQYITYNLWCFSLLQSYYNSMYESTWLVKF